MQTLKVNGENLKFGKWTYVDYSSSNYGANAICVELGERTIYFSYDTIVAFRGTNSKGERFPLTVSANCWGPTTGKHLNAIDYGQKDKRLPREEFEKKLVEFLS